MSANRGALPSETEHRAAGSQRPDPRRFTPRAEQHWESRATRRMKRERGEAEASAAPEGASAAAAESRGSEWWEAIPIPSRSLAGGGRQEAGAPATERNQEEKEDTSDARLRLPPCYFYEKILSTNTAISTSILSPLAHLIILRTYVVHQLI